MFFLSHENVRRGEEAVTFSSGSDFCDGVYCTFFLFLFSFFACKCCCAHTAADVVCKRRHTVVATKKICANTRVFRCCRVATLSMYVSEHYVFTTEITPGNIPRKNSGEENFTVYS